MRLCMFHPVDRPMERGWVGRLDGDHVVHLAAQTLQSFFTGGGSAREHAVYPLAEVRLLAPVLHPPAVRVFADRTSFEFANPAAIVGPGAEIGSGAALALLPRVAAVIGAAGAIAGFTACADWRRPGVAPPKDRDFALGVGPVLVTPEELASDDLAVVVRAEGAECVRASWSSFDWAAARDHAAEGTRLLPGDLLVGPAAGLVEVDGGSMELDVAGIGVLRQRVAP